MVSTGDKRPTATEVPAGATGWSLPTKAYAPYSEDASCAYASADNRKQNYFNYGFGIPPGSTINKVYIKLYDALVSKEGTSNEIFVYVSWDGGVTWSGAAIISPVFGVCEESGLDQLDATSLTDWTPEKLADGVFKVQVVSATGAGCFAIGSKVRMFDGSLKNIEDIHLGDEVLSWRPTEKWCKGVVVGVTKHDWSYSRLLVKLMTKLGELILASQHKVCVTKEHTFTEVDNLEVGDCLLTEKDELQPILSIEDLKVSKMVNLEIDKLTFVVNGFLVHNLVKQAW